MKKIILILSFLTIIPAGILQAGDIIENFRLLDHQGKSHELHYYSDKKGIVLIWQENDCSVIRENIDYLHELKEKYEKKGIQFFMVNASPQDNRFSIQKEVEELGIQFLVLEDRAQLITIPLGVEQTTTAVLIDSSSWKILYQGAIHDQLSNGSTKRKIKKHYLRDAMKAHLTNKPVEITKTSISPGKSSVKIKAW